MATVDPRSSGDRMWERESRFGRRAEVVFVDRLTETGTVRIRGRVTAFGITCSSIRATIQASVAWPLG